MDIEKLKPLTEEEKRKTKSRMISDGILAKGGAEIRDNGSLEVTRDQKKQARIEMETDQGLYSEHTTINGITLDVSWDNHYGDYVIFFPDIIRGPEAERNNINDQVIILKGGRDIAKRVFDFACQTAKNKNDLYTIYHQVENFVDSLPDPDDDDE